MCPRRVFVPWVLLTIVACGGGGGQPSATPASGPGGLTAAFFPPAAVWYADVSGAPRDRESAAVIAYLDRVGWGLGRLQIDFSIEVIQAPPDAPLLFSADEVAAGSIDHAIRFLLPNARSRRGEYVHRATHGTRAATGPPEAPPYGAR